MQSADSVCSVGVIEASEVLDLLSSLAEKSLIVTAEKGGETRYLMLETVRQYARDRLLERGEAEEWRSRHLDSYLSLAEEAGPHFKEADEQEWLERLEAEHDNLLTAIRWSVSNTSLVAAGLRICARIAGLWARRGHLTVGRACCLQVLEAADGLPDSVEKAQVVSAAGDLAFMQVDLDAAWSLATKSLAMGEALGSSWVVHKARCGLAVVAGDRGDFVEALRQINAALDLARQETLATDFHIAVIGNMLARQGDFIGAIARYEESYALSAERNDRRKMAHTLTNLGQTLVYQGELNSARLRLTECLAICSDLGERRSVLAGLENLALVELRDGSHERGTVCYGAAEALRETDGIPQNPFERDEHREPVSRLRELLGEEAFAAAWAKGRAMSMEQAIDYALSGKDAEAGED